ncbi:MAG: hypothetical protein K0R25_1177 [Rickettsiaceae bacterium]|jgi:signal transduction histidine kinase|nr:hypothetical protein [Rickettsiaceae bacterium]
MNEIAITILLFLSSTLGIKDYPTDTQQWKIISAWEKTEEGYFIFSAINKNIAKSCKNNPSFYIKFPSVIHSSSQLKIDSRIISSTGLPDFKHIRGFYGSLIVPCFQLKGDEILIWEAVSYTKYFARFHYFPKVVKHYPKEILFDETLNIVAAAILLALCPLYLILFTGKISKEKLLSLIFSNFFTSIYFIGNSIGVAGFSMSMLTAHKMADSGLCLGFLFFINFLYLENLVFYWMNLVYKISISIALTIILTGSTGDVIQLGTTIPFIPTLAFILFSIKSLANKDPLKSQSKILQLIGLILFLTTYLNDAFLVLGILNTMPIASIGWISGYIFILFSMNESISITYAERDQLKILSDQLKQTNENLTKAQDELIKSEKMAAMGRAVARIAHELNTPIYLIRSSAQNIQSQTRKFLNLISLQNQKSLLEDTKEYEKNLNKMSENLMISASRAAELVRNFKEISTDQINIKNKDFELLGYIKKSLATMSDTLKRKKIEVNLMGDEVVLNSDAGLFYQIIQNLITNAQKYAYDAGGVIDITITKLDKKVILTFSDYGKGIPEENLPKIFDAFFTTGGGSGGVGLGLNIIYRIITIQLKGEIACVSKPGKGTTFIITIPV